MKQKLFLILAMFLLALPFSFAQTTTYEIAENYTGDSEDRPCRNSLWCAQTFTVGNQNTNKNYNISKIEVTLSNSSGANNNLAFCLYSTDANGPKTALSCNHTAYLVPMTSIPTAFNISIPPYEINASGVYAIVGNSTSEGGGTIYVVQNDATSPTYTGGNQYQSGNSGDSWISVTTRDVLFKVWGQINTTTSDTTPPEINFYWATSDSDPSCTRWNDNKQNPCNTTDKTPTVKINLSEPSYCAISTLNLNYTGMIANDPLTNCTGAPNALGKNLTCTLPDTKAFTSPGLFNISIGCKDEAGNQNRSSTSGNLTINLTDATPPTVTLEKPDNNVILFFKDRPFRFNFTATDEFGLLNMSCSLYFNNTLNQTNSSVKNGTLTNWALINLSRNVWQWNVTCTDNSSNAGSSARIVTINNSKPTAPTLQTPSNNSGFGNLPSNLPEFTWNNSADGDSDAITYTIEVNNQSSFDGNRVYFNSSVPQDSDGVTGVNVTLPSNDEDAYFWRVRGNDGIENSSNFSQTFQFGYANWTIKFNLTSSDTGKELVTIGAGGASAHFDISCSNGHTDIDVENPHTDTNSFSHGTYNCTFSQIKDTIPEDYRDRTITFTATNDTTIEVVVSRVGGLTEEEHNWLQFLYTCFNSGECIDLLRTINQTTKDIWKRVTGTDTSVVLFENITTNTLSATSNISIDYTIDIPVKEGYAVGALLPLRMFFWITDVNKTRCFNQDKATDTNRAEAPYCLPLVAETLGPNGGQVNFTVDLRPNVPNGDYNITRSIEIDPIINNAVRWINYGQDNLGQIKVSESGNAASYLIKTGESIPEKSIKELTDITGASFITIKLTSKAVKIIIIILSVITITLFGYIIYSKKKRKKTKLIFHILIFFWGISISSDLVNANLFSNSSWLDTNLTNAQYGTFGTVAFGDIDNDGDKDFVLSGCRSGGLSGCAASDAEPTRVYLNNGTALNISTVWSQNLSALGTGSASLADLDNDGDLDLILDGSGVFLTIYINNGQTFTSNSTWESAPRDEGTDASGINIIGDVDNDGDLDLITAPVLNKNVLLNNGSTFINNVSWGSDITELSHPKSDLLDYDNDGDLDLLTYGFGGSNQFLNNGTAFSLDTNPSGDIGGGERHSQVIGDIDNDGDIDYLQVREDNTCGNDVLVNNVGFFIKNSTWASFVGRFYSTMALGDYDNNGYLDLVVSGQCGPPSNILYTNNKTIFNSNQTLQGAQTDTQVWVDVNNDGKLDLFSMIPIMYINNLSTANTNPSPPTTLNVTFNRDTDLINFSWNAGSDTETPAAGLYYNLKIGTTSGGNEIVTGVYGSQSYNRVTGSRTSGFFGNMMQRKVINLKNTRFRESTTYYWSVQSIDTGLANGSWSGEYLFNTTADWTEPVITLNKPIDFFNTTNFTITFNATVYDLINLSNVSLYGNWSGTFAYNGTNSSGFNNTDYILARNLTSIGDGTYKWLINACDNSSNCVNSSIRTFTIDTTAPVVNLSNPANGTWTNNANVNFRFTARDSLIQACTLYGNFNGAFQANISNTSMVSVTQTTFNLNLQNGTFLWNVLCNDTIGNNAFNATNFTINVDTEKPAININSPVNNFNTSNVNVTINWTVIDNLDNNLPCNITINGTINQSNIPSLNGTHTNKTINNFNDGFYFWNVSCTDNATNVNFSITRNFTIDTIFPNITLNYPLNNSWLNKANTTFNFTLTEINPKRCLLFANFSGNFTENQSINPSSGKNNFSQKTIADGRYIWGVFCNDTVNHENYSINFSLNIDTIFPAVRLDNPKNNSNFSSNPIQFNFTVTEANLDSCSLYLNSSGWHKNTTKTDMTSNAVFNVANLTIADGNYFYNAVCNDSAGNEAFNATNLTFSVDAAAPAVTLLSPLNSSTIATSDVVARASFTDQNIVNCQARIDSGTVQEMTGDGIVSGTASFTFTSQSDAQHTININCTDTSAAKFSTIVNTTFTVDSTITDTSKPNLTIVFPPNTSITSSSPIKLELNYSDGNNVNCKLINGSSVYDFDNDNATAGTANLTLALHDKNHTISANCTDTSSNQNNIILSVWNFYLDAAYPVVSLISPANNTRQTSSSTVTFTYNVTDLGIKNCSLVIDDIVNLTDTSVSTGTAQSFSKSLDNNNYNWSVNCFDNAGLANSSITFNLTVSFTESGSSGSSGSSGGGGGGGGGGAAATAPETTKTQVWQTLPEGSNTMKINKEEISVDEIEINVKNPLNNVEVSVTKLDEKPATITQEVTGKVYQYIEINKKNLKDDDISNAVINFKVEKSWIIDNNADESDVALNRYTASWEELETSKLNSDAKYAYYKAITPSFSYFAVSVKEKITQEIENITISEIANITEPEANATGEAQEEMQKEDYSSLAAIAVVFVLVILVVFFYWKKKK